MDRIAPSARRIRLALVFLGLAAAAALLAPIARTSAETAKLLPAPAVDGHQASGDRGRGLRRWLLLGRAGCVRACEGRDAGGLRLRGRPCRQPGLRTGQHGHDRPCRVGQRDLRSRSDQLWNVVADLLFGGARSHAGGPPGTGLGQRSTARRCS